jgi:hypothetical protein
MEESHVEGVAIHDDPEPCTGAREGAGEAWDRGRRGPGIEPRNFYSRTPTVLSEPEGNTHRTESARWNCPVLEDRFDCLNQARALVSNSMGET